MRIINKKMGWNYMNLAVTAFGGLGVELLYAFILEPFLYGAQMGNWAAGQTIAHWILTCATWGGIGVWLVRTAEKKYSLDILSVREKMQPWQWTAAMALVAVSAIIQYFQYLYYAFETVLFMMIIVFGQKACELWLGHEKIPYGGILCGLTWGLGHILSKGSLLAGLHGLLWGILLGTAYLVANKEIRKTWVLLFLMFVV